MIERIRPPTPLELTIDETLSEKKTVHLELHAEELEEVISMLIQHMFLQNGVSEAETPNVKVTLVQEMATVEVQATIKKPIKATFNIVYFLLNSPIEPGRLQPRNIRIDIQAGFVARAALKAQMVDEKIRYTLQNITETIMKNPPPIMQEHGHSFSDISLTLENSILAVQLTSE